MSEFDRAVNEMHIICALVPSAAPMFRLLIEGGTRLERENAELRARVAALEAAAASEAGRTVGTPGTVPADGRLHVFSDEEFDDMKVRS